MEIDKRKDDKTSVGRVKLGKTLDLGTRLSPCYLGNLLACDTHFSL